MKLSDGGINADFRIVSNDLDDRLAFRLREMGLGPGARIRILRKTFFSGLVLDVRGERVAIDTATAKKIYVEDADKNQPDTHCDPEVSVA